jgi:hypothetical protein
MANGNGVVAHENVFDNEPYDSLRSMTLSVSAALRRRARNAVRVPARRRSASRS